MAEMQSGKLVKHKVTESTQKYLDIAEIKEDSIVLNDGSLRAVIAVSSTNFSLKSESEQNAIISSYQGFINSLEFPVQILIQSRVLDIQGYLEKLKGLMGTQTNELLRIQMGEYIEYVGKLVDFASIMNKTFYVVVSYSTNPVSETFMGKIKKLFNPTSEIVRNQSGFEKSRGKLEERTTQIVSKLASMGLRSIVLTTQELIELMYNSYIFSSASPLHAESFSAIEVGDVATEEKNAV